MDTKTLEKRTSTFTNHWLDVLEPFDWFEDLVPRVMKMKNSDWKSLRIEEFIKDGKVVIKAEMPGLDPEKDIEVSVQDGRLTIQGERQHEMQDDHRCEFSYGSFYRSVLLPRGTDEKSIHAQYKDGILEVTLNLPRETSNGKKIPVLKG